MTHTLYTFLFAVLLLGGCSGNNNWPALNAPLPDPAAREKVFKRAEPSAKPRRPAAAAPESFQDAEELLADITNRLSKARADYMTARGDVVANPKDGVRWRGAQISLTRLSLMSEDLNPLADTERVTLSTLKAEAEATRSKLDLFLKDERQWLAVRKPSD